MTAFDSWLKTNVLAVVRDMQTENEPDWGTIRPSDTVDYRANYAADWAALNQRIAIALIQARAIECRTLAGELNVLGVPGAQMLAARCMDRSHKLEAVGMKYAKEWPPEWWEMGRILM